MISHTVWLADAVCLQLFFAKVPSAATVEEVTELFSKYGAVSDLNLFRAWAGAKNSKVGVWRRLSVSSWQPHALASLWQVYRSATHEAVTAGGPQFCRPCMPWRA